MRPDQEEKIRWRILAPFPNLLARLVSSVKRLTEGERKELSRYARLYSAFNLELLTPSGYLIRSSIPGRALTELTVKLLTSTSFPWIFLTCPSHQQFVKSASTASPTAYLIQKQSVTSETCELVQTILARNSNVDNRSFRSTREKGYQLQSDMMQHATRELLFFTCSKE
jgi:DNA-binding NarL/FixJ family response regulator